MLFKVQFQLDCNFIFSFKHGIEGKFFIINVFVSSGKNVFLQNLSETLF